jgi:hypothetical protein
LLSVLTSNALGQVINHFSSQGINNDRDVLTLPYLSVNVFLTIFSMRKTHPSLANKPGSTEIRLYGEKLLNDLAYIYKSVNIYNNE